MRGCLGNSMTLSPTALFVVVEIEVEDKENTPRYVQYAPD